MNGLRLKEAASPSLRNALLGCSPHLRFRPRQRPAHFSFRALTRRQRNVRIRTDYQAWILLIVDARRPTDSWRRRPVPVHRARQRRCLRRSRGAYDLAVQHRCACIWRTARKHTVQIQRPSPALGHRAKYRVSIHPSDCIGLRFTHCVGSPERRSRKRAEPLDVRSRRAAASRRLRIRRWASAIPATSRHGVNSSCIERR